MITCDITAASGWQSFTVEASSPEEAKKIFKSGGAEFLAEEIEVSDLSDQFEIEEYEE